MHVRKRNTGGAHGCPIQDMGHPGTDHSSSADKQHYHSALRGVHLRKRKEYGHNGGARCEVFSVEVERYLCQISL